MTEMERIIQDLRILARWDNLPTVIKKAIIQSKKREEIERSKKRVEEDKYLEFDVNEFEKFCDDHQQNNIGGRMSIKKSDRILVFQKCGGHCAYCGKKIELEEMQVDHIQPKRLGGKDELENYHPSCRRCNHYKRTLTLEKFRKLIMTLTERLQKIYIVKVAIDYGIITLNKWDGKFYFEKEEQQCS